MSKLWNIEQIILWHMPAMRECTITSGNDGRHSKRSKHYRNTGVDFRTWYYDEKGQHYIDDQPGAREKIEADLQKLLGDDYQAVWHDRDHLHIEWDP